MVVQAAGLVHLQLLVVPVGQERVGQELRIVDHLHEGGSLRLHLRIPHEQQDHGLEDALLAIFVLRGQLREDVLVRGPVFDRRPLHAEDPAHQDVDLVVGRQHQTNLSLTRLF